MHMDMCARRQALTRQVPWNVPALLSQVLLPGPPACMDTKYMVVCQGLHALQQWHLCMRNEPRLFSKGAGAAQKSAAPGANTWRSHLPNMLQPISAGPL